MPMPPRELNFNPIFVNYERNFHENRRKAKSIQGPKWEEKIEDKKYSSTDQVISHFDTL